jgi:chemosensory pili system protein ChpA (sensor histidine kinase/response regulator)
MRERGLAAGLLGPRKKPRPDARGRADFCPGNLDGQRGVAGLAGRGIGMDVLSRPRSAAWAAASKSSPPPARALTFRLYLPLTLAVTKALLVRSGNKQYAIPSVDDRAGT